MANMVGVWKLVPNLTTGHYEFGKEIGMSDDEIEESRNDVYIYTITCDGDEWGIKVDVENGGNWINVKFRMGVPFNFIGLDKVTKHRSVILLKDGRWDEEMTWEKDGVTRDSHVDTYREGEFLIQKQTINGKTETTKLQKQ